MGLNTNKLDEMVRKSLQEISRIVQLQISRKNYTFVDELHNSIITFNTSYKIVYLQS